MDYIGTWLAGNLGTVLGVLWTVLLPLMVRWVRREVRPYLEVERRHQTAQWIARLADDLTDDLRVRYPQSRWTARLDEAVDQLVEAAGIRPEIARRAVHAAAGRKLDAGATSGATEP